MNQRRIIGWVCLLLAIGITLIGAVSVNQQGQAPQEIQIETRTTTGTLSLHPGVVLLHGQRVEARWQLQDNREIYFNNHGTIGEGSETQPATHCSLFEWYVVFDDTSASTYRLAPHFILTQAPIFLGGVAIVSLLAMTLYLLGGEAAHTLTWRGWGMFGSAALLIILLYLGIFILPVNCSPPVIPTLYRTLLQILHWVAILLAIILLVIAIWQPKRLYVPSLLWSVLFALGICLIASPGLPFRPALGNFFQFGYPWFISAVGLSMVLFTLITCFQHLRIRQIGIATLLSAWVVIGLLSNLQALQTTPPLQTLDGNSLVDLDPQNYDAVSAYIDVHYAGHTMIYPPDFVFGEQRRMWFLEAWTSLAKVEERDYDATLSEAEYDALQAYEMVERTGIGRNQPFVFVEVEESDTETIWLMRYAEQKIAIPESLLPERVQP